MSNVVNLVFVKYHVTYVWKKNLRTKNIWYYKIIFNSTTPMLSLKLSKLGYLSSSLTYSMSDDVFLLYYFIRSVFCWLCNVLICVERKVLRFFCQQGYIYMHLYICILYFILYILYYIIYIIYHYICIIYVCRNFSWKYFACNNLMDW